MKLKLRLLSRYVIGFFASVIAICFLWILYPFHRIKVGALIASRIGHLALNPELFSRHRQIKGFQTKTKYIFIAGRPCNRQLLTMWKRHLLIVESRILYGLWIVSEWLWARTPFYEPLGFEANAYDVFHGGKPTLKFTAEEEKRGESFLKGIGLNPEKDWFVCVFARDSLYLKNTQPNGKWSYHDYRNADIDTFRLAIDHIVERGGYVFRMGHFVSKPLNHQHPRVIDYAIRCRDDFMDIYLVAKCRFFLGTPAGIADVVVLFDTPRLAVDWAPPGCAPLSRNSLFIPKKVRDRKTGKYVPFKVFFSRTKDPWDPVLWLGHKFVEAGYEYEDNDAEEIRGASIEMFERLEGKFVPSEEDEKLQMKYFQSFSTDHWGVKIKTPIGRDFLRKNRVLLGEE